ncbi:hypothetical protein KP78_10990 [Jeotgalibacillus soli]|uniref:Uncharacterized protein n=1 Tax=Jeotgalibacillus soli TaxID=889306 RepID=A0A0C2VZ12_9BACL|nr:hypothetical protein KP78_10990 [Jeotgalibacillus soli]
MLLLIQGSNILTLSKSEEKNLSSRYDRERKEGRATCILMKHSY